MSFPVSKSVALTPLVSSCVWSRLASANCLSLYRTQVTRGQWVALAAVLLILSWHCTSWWAQVVITCEGFHLSCYHLVCLGRWVIWYHGRCYPHALGPSWCYFRAPVDQVQRSGSIGTKPVLAGVFSCDHYLCSARYALSSSTLSVMIRG